MSSVICAQRGAVIINKDTVSSNRSVYAVIIGISDYKNVQDLLFADKDALAFRNYLLQYFDSVIKEDNIELFINESATRIQVCDAISRIVKKVKKGDRVYFYFAGHGDIEDYSQMNNGLLLLYDSPAGDYFGMSDGVIQVNQLADYFGRLSEMGVEVLNIIDACHSGKLKGGNRGLIHTSRAIQSNLSQQSILMLSCDQDQLSIEGIEWGGGRGIFSYFLEEGLIGLADLDGDKQITLLEIEQYVKRLTYLQSERRQTPVFMGDQNRIISQIDQIKLDSIKQIGTSLSFQYADIYVKGNDSIYLNSLDSISLNHYNKFYSYLKDQKILDSTLEHAVYHYHAFVNLNSDHYLSVLMRRKLALNLNAAFDSLMAPILNGRQPKLSMELIQDALVKIDSCLNLFEQYHYMYPHFLSRKYVLEAIKNAFHLHIGNYKPKSDSLTMIKSLDYLNRAKNLEPNAGYVYFYLGLYHQTMFQFDSSLVYLRKLLQILPNSALVYNLVGLSLSDLGDVDGGIRSFKRAIELNENFHPAYGNLAIVYCDYLKKYNDAIYWASRALELKPGFIPAHNVVIRSYLNSEQMSHARGAIQRSFNFDSLNRRTWFYLGLYNYKLGVYDSAVYFFKKTLKIAPKYLDPMIYIALTDKLQGNYIRAAHSFIDYSSFDSTLLMEAAYCYKLAGLEDSARYYFSKSRSMESSGNKNYWQQGDLMSFGFSDYYEAEKFYSLNMKETDSLDVDVLCRAFVNAFLCKLPDRAEVYWDYLNMGYVPKYASLFTNSIRLYFHGNILESKDLMKKAIAANPEVKWWIIQNDKLRDILD
jgi:tetratricopeptide (TPR) repeat protein